MSTVKQWLKLHTKKDLAEVAVNHQVIIGRQVGEMKEIKSAFEALEKDNDELTDTIRDLRFRLLKSEKNHEILKPKEPETVFNRFQPHRIFDRANLYNLPNLPLL